jgi:hypothetical protein
MKLSECNNEHGRIGFWDKTVSDTDDVGFFGIAQHVAITNIQVEQDGSIRCDATSRKGPQGFHEWLGDRCSCGKLEPPYGPTGNHHIAFGQLVAIFPVIEALPYGHIMYFELLDPANEVKAIEEIHSDCARTLQEVFRLLLEWDFAYRELGSTERIAEVSHGIVQVLEIPQSIVDWILAEVPGEKVSRYLAGIDNAQQRADIADIPPLSDEFSEWLYDKISATRSIGEYDADRSNTTGGQ